MNATIELKAYKVLELAEAAIAKHVQTTKELYESVRQKHVANRKRYLWPVRWWLAAWTGLHTDPDYKTYETWVTNNDPFLMMRVELGARGVRLETLLDLSKTASLLPSSALMRLTDRSFLILNNYVVSSIQ